MVPISPVGNFLAVVVKNADPGAWPTARPALPGLRAASCGFITVM
jgi:hypothetical protein